MKRHAPTIGIVGAWIVLASMALAGCDWKTDKTRWFDPTSLVKAPERSPLNPILETVSPVDEYRELPPNATFPRDEDLEYEVTDYVIGPTDVLDISILDLYVEGMETVLRRQVSDSGFIDLPLLGEKKIKASGLTAIQLTEEIVKAYRPDVLLNPVVSVTIMAPHQNVFSALGAIQRPGTYNLLRKDMRLLDALALAGGLSQTNIRYLLIIRPAPAAQRAPSEKATVPAPETPGPAVPSTPGLVPPGATSPEASRPAGPAGDLEKALRELGEAVPGGATSRPSKPLGPPSAMPNLAELTTTAVSQAAQPIAEPTKTYRWVFTADGRWERVEQEAPAVSQPSGQGGLPVRPARGLETSTTAESQLAAKAEEDRFGWKKLEKSGLARIIAVDLPRLQSGDARMNIIVRDSDVIQVPMLEMGEFYIMGEVGNPGVYSLSGRRITVKMAVAAARNLDVLAWPENSILIRRIGDNQEQIIPLNIEKIFRGEEPDLFLKPDDVIAVGTDIAAPFLAVIRNAFRLTYGFGFIYDRNFSDVSPGERILNSKRFTRW